MAEAMQATFVVDEDLCYGCGACIALCPTNALDLVDRLAVVEQSDCTLCELSLIHISEPTRPY